MAVTGTNNTGNTIITTMDLKRKAVDDDDTSSPKTSNDGRPTNKKRAVTTATAAATAAATATIPPTTAAVEKHAVQGQGHSSLPNEIMSPGPSTLFSLSPASLSLLQPHLTAFVQFRGSWDRGRRTQTVQPKAGKKDGPGTMETYSESFRT